ncbi:hypothetical protein Tco_1414712 [Tanacetum coccineum]
MEHYPHLDNGIYNVADRVMRPLALKQTRKPRSDRGKPKARHSVSSSSAYHYGSSSHHVDEDKDDNDSCASTPSPTTYLNSLSPLNYEKYDIPTSSQQDDDLLFERQTTLLNQTQQIHEEVRAMSPPPRVPSPPPTQESRLMDVTLTLSPITLLDVQFNTPSPPSPLFGHPISWNLLEAHGNSCLYCIHNRTLIFGLRDEIQYMLSCIEHILSQPPPPNSPPPPPPFPN